jgi:hypothetical protein
MDTTQMRERTPISIGLLAALILNQLRNDRWIKEQLDTQEEHPEQKQKSDDEEPDEPESGALFDGHGFGSC